MSKIKPGKVPSEGESMRDARNKCGPEENGPAILSRRSLLELTGIVVATVALPPKAVDGQIIPQHGHNRARGEPRHGQAQHIHERS